MSFTSNASDLCRRDEPLPWLGGLRASEFLRDYWQKKPLLVRGAFPALADLISFQELLQLAEEDSLESRVISGPDAKGNWKLKNGPFPPVTWRKHGKQNWTVLVQAVDHVLPTLSDLLDHFAFVPEWRIDDVMVSGAVVGGSVGPHSDQYDVFLLQGPGSRHWQLGQQVAVDEALLPDQPLRLLANFQQSFEATVETGDLLYVPPGLAHHGVATSDCLTYSVGFRAPAVPRLLDALADRLLSLDENEPLLADPDRGVCQHSASLTALDTNAMRTAMLAWINQPEQMALAMAPSLSEAKYADYEAQGESCSLADLQSALAEGIELIRDPASRWVWLPEVQQLWRNGECVDIPADIIEHVPALLTSRRLRQAQLAALPELVLQWLADDISAGFWLAVEAA
jgi:50S ribosomal protein L16 3-hydroxylase